MSDIGQGMAKREREVCVLNVADSMAEQIVESLRDVAWRNARRGPDDLPVELVLDGHDCAVLAQWALLKKGHR